MIEIIPTLTFQTTDEVQRGVDRYAGLVSRVHLDCADGDFVPNRLANLWEVSRVTWPTTYEAHLMVAAGANWAADVILFPACDGAIIHAECDDIDRSIFETIRQHHKLAGIALRPETPADALTDYIEVIDQVTVLLVEPGTYGGQFLPEMLDKIAKIRQRWPDLAIQADGGMNPETASLAVQAGATSIAVGSYLQQADPALGLAQLQQAITGVTTHD